MNKIVCFDLDGVAVAEHAKFSDRLIERQGAVIISAVQEYFSETIKPYLGRFGQSGDTQSILDFWFDGEKEAIQPVLNLARCIQDSGTPTYIVTDNPAERTTKLWDELLGGYFSDRFVSGETGLKKSSPDLWKMIATKTSVSPSDIFFTDDDLENIEVAKSDGVHAKLFVGYTQLSVDIDQFLLDV